MPVSWNVLVPPHSHIGDGLAAQLGMLYCMSHVQLSHPRFAKSHKYIAELVTQLLVLSVLDVEEEIGSIFEASTWGQCGKQILVHS